MVNNPTMTAITPLPLRSPLSAHTPLPPGGIAPHPSPSPTTATRPQQPPPPPQQQSARVTIAEAARVACLKLAADPACVARAGGELPPRFVEFVASPLLLHFLKARERSRALDPLPR